MLKVYTKNIYLIICRFSSDFFNRFGLTFRFGAVFQFRLYTPILNLTSIMEG